MSDFTDIPKDLPDEELAIAAKNWARTLAELDALVASQAEHEHVPGCRPPYCLSEAFILRTPTYERPHLLLILHAAVLRLSGRNENPGAPT